MAAEITSVATLTSATASRTDSDDARLSLDPATARHAGINGAWWPRSADAAAELPALIAGIGAQAGRVRRIALQIDAFVNIPHLLIAAGRKVHVGWFRHMNPHTVILTMADQDDLVLLVIPPQASPAAAAEALRLAALDRKAVAPEQILAAAYELGGPQSVTDLAANR